MSTTEPKWLFVHTPLGAQIKIGQPPEIFGTGVVMILGMQDPHDSRTAEVQLDDASLNALILSLQAHQKK